MNIRDFSTGHDVELSSLVKFLPCSPPPPLSSPPLPPSKLPPLAPDSNRPQNSHSSPQSSNSHHKAQFCTSCLGCLVKYIHQLPKETRGLSIDDRLSRTISMGQAEGRLSDLPMMREVLKLRRRSKISGEGRLPLHESRTRSPGTKVPEGGRVMVRRMGGRK
jgi:hypothetical protein